MTSRMSYACDHKKGRRHYIGNISDRNELYLLLISFDNFSHIEQPFVYDFKIVYIYIILYRMQY